MLANISKSARSMAIAYCFAGISGCSTEGAVGELAAMGMLVGGAASGDTGLMIAGVAGYAGVMIVEPLLSEESESGTSSYPVLETPTTTPSANTAPPVTAATLIAAEVPDAYRSESCDYLEVALVFANERLEGRKKANDIEGQQVAQARMTARSQALRDKKCPPSSWVGGRIGISMDNIDPRYVATYHIPAEGAMVLMVSPNSAAEKAGIKVGDIIVAVNDKPVRNAIDLRTMLGHAPIGSLQHLKVRRDATFLVASAQMEGPAVQLPIVTVSASAAAAPAAQKPIAEPAKPANAVHYCYAYLTVGEERGSTCSPVVEVNDADGSGSVFQKRLSSYVEKVKQSQPGIWGDFEYADTIKMQNAFIYQMKPKGSADASKQDAGLICYESQADASAQLKRSQKNDSSLKIVGWP